MKLFLLITFYLWFGVGAIAAELPLIDGHIHYSHDAWELTSPEEAVAILRAAGLKKALVSSSSDEGTQRLYKAAPDLVVPVLRPYRWRGETGSWFQDETVPEMLADRIARYKYAGIGEFHVDGADADLPVMRAVVRLAKEHKLFLHAHSDAAAINAIFLQDPDARILWAHAGFEPLDIVRATLKKHPNLWADLAFRSVDDAEGKVDDDWRKMFEDFPERFILGTDTYTPSRWSFVTEHAALSRHWLKDLPKHLAVKIAWENAANLIGPNW